MILIVDDDLALGTALEKMFRFAGHNVVHIASGLEALALLPIRKPHIIMMDLKMPTMDGMTLLRAIRQDKTYQNVPILVYTADFSAAKKDEALRAGAQDFIVKGTMGWEPLLARVEKLLPRDPSRT